MGLTGAGGGVGLGRSATGAGGGGGTKNSDLPRIAANCSSDAFAYRFDSASTFGEGTESALVRITAARPTGHSDATTTTPAKAAAPSASTPRP